MHLRNVCAALPARVLIRNQRHGNDTLLICQAIARGKHKAFCLQADHDDVQKLTEPDGTPSRGLLTAIRGRIAQTSRPDIALIVVRDAKGAPCGTAAQSAAPIIYLVEITLDGRVHGVALDRARERRPARCATGCWLERGGPANHHRELGNDAHQHQGLPVHAGH